MLWDVSSVSSAAGHPKASERARHAKGSPKPPRATPLGRVDVGEQHQPRSLLGRVDVGEQHHRLGFAAFLNQLELGALRRLRHEELVEAQRFAHHLRFAGSANKILDFFQTLIEARSEIDSDPDRFCFLLQADYLPC